MRQVLWSLNTDMAGIILLHAVNPHVQIHSLIQNRCATLHMCAWIVCVLHIQHGTFNMKSSVQGGGMDCNFVLRQCSSNFHGALLVRKYLAFPSNLSSLPCTQKYVMINVWSVWMPSILFHSRRFISIIESFSHSHLGHLQRTVL